MSGWQVMSDAKGQSLPDPRLPVMRGLTLTQPWASLVALGAKTLETRSWKTNYRGLLAIHAAQGLGGLAGGLERPRTPRESDLAELCAFQPFKRKLLPHVPPEVWAECAGKDDDEVGRLIAGSLPRGKIVAVVALTGCLSTGKRGADSGRARDGADLGLLARLHEMPDEAGFGNYGPGRYAFVLEELVRLLEPLPAPMPRFKQGLWEPVWSTRVLLYRHWESAR